MLGGGEFGGGLSECGGGGRALVRFGQVTARSAESPGMPVATSTVRVAIMPPPSRWPSLACGKRSRAFHLGDIFLRRPEPLPASRQEIRQEWYSRGAGRCQKE